MPRQSSIRPFRGKLKQKTKVSLDKRFSDTYIEAILENYKNIDIKIDESQIARSWGQIEKALRDKKRN